MLSRHKLGGQHKGHHKGRAGGQHSWAIPLGPQFGPIFQFSYCQTYGQVIDVTNHGK